MSEVKMCKKCGKAPRYKERTSCHTCEKERQSLAKQKARTCHEKRNKMKEQQQRSNKKHAIKRKEKARDYYENRGGREKKREYDRDNKERAAKWARDRRHTNLAFHLRGILRTRLLDALKRQLKGGEVTKRHSAVGSLGCSIPELISHLERQFEQDMSWENYGTFWSVDHIRPMSSVDITTDEGIALVCHFTNLRPLTIVENSRKGPKWEPLD
jgi:hypothetical protein